MSQEKKRSFSDRQLDTVLDGGYWAVTSSSRLKRSSSKHEFGSSPNSKAKESQPTPTSPPPASSSINTHTLPPSADFYVPPTSISSHTIDFTPPSPNPPTNGTISYLSNDVDPLISNITDIKPQSTTDDKLSVPHIPITSTSLSTIKVDHSKIDKLVHVKQENPLVVYQDPPSNVDLDGSYWATFDPNQKRKKDRVLGDLTGSDADYWNKRNTRVAQRKPQPAPVLSDDQVAKRQEKIQLKKEEHRRRGEEEHERLLKKQQEAEVGKEIFPGIFLGSRQAAKNWEFFTSCQIRGVVNVTTDIRNYHETSGVEYKRIPISDLPSENFLEQFDVLAASLKELSQKGNVLVHCREGKSRSPSLCLAYGMRVLGLNLSSAHESIVSKSEIRINYGFQQQLMSYEKTVFGQDFNTYNFLKKRNATPEKDRNTLTISK